MSVEENKMAAWSFLEDIWSKGDNAAIDKLLSPNFAFILSFMRTDGREAFKNLLQANRTAFRNLTYIMEDVVADENKAAAYWTMTGTHMSTWNNVDPTGKDVSIQGMTFYKFADGKIIEAKVQNDVIGLMQQLDAISMTAPLKRNKEAVRRYYDVILNQRDFDRFEEVASPNFIGHRSSMEVRGSEGLKAQMDMFVTAFPDIYYEIEEMICEEDKVTVHFRAPGTQNGEFAGIPPTGKKVEWRGNMIYRLEDGRVAELLSYLNDYDLIRELQE